MVECGGCTLCCMMLNVKCMNSPSYQWCPHCDIGRGCRIHETKSDECKNYDCMYVQQEKCNISLRPDRCKIIFEKLNDDMILALLHPDRKDITDVARKQIHRFVTLEGYSVLLKSRTKPLQVYVPKGVDANKVFARFQDLEKEALNNLRNPNGRQTEEEMEEKVDDSTIIYH